MVPAGMRFGIPTKAHAQTLQQQITDVSMKYWSTRIHLMDFAVSSQMKRGCSRLSSDSRPICSVKALYALCIPIFIVVFVKEERRLRSVFPVTAHARPDFSNRQ